MFGNPPFVGKQFRNAEQRADMNRVWGDVPGAGVLDYVTCWYRKATQYVAHREVPSAFVSTNSITQGEQVGVLWADLFRQQRKIQFGHRTFAWTSEARGRAHVHVVIIGFGTQNPSRKRLYEYSDDGTASVSEVPNISPYLIAGSDSVVRKRSRPLTPRPAMVFGSMPNDGGHLLLDSEAKAELLAIEPSASRYVRRIVGSDEFLSDIDRWCLWLVDADPATLRGMPEVLRRVEAVRQQRSMSSRDTTRELAHTPTLFGEIRQPLTDYLLVPGASSENRRYIPMGFMPADVIASNLVYCIEGADSWHCGVLSSAMHMSWVATVCGRLKSDYRYSNRLVYNNFPWPSDDIEERRRTAVRQKAQAILEVRRPYLRPDGTNSLSDLYDPLAMPPALIQAHRELDHAVDRCYRPEAFGSDRERVEHLFASFEALVAPLAEGTSRRRRKQRRD